MKTFGQFFSEIYQSWEGLQNRLTQIDQEPLVKQYPQVRGPKRMETITGFRMTTLAQIEQFRQQDIPALKKQDQANVSTAIANVRAGRPPDQGPAAPKPAVDPAAWLPDGAIRVAFSQMTGDMATALADLRQQMQISNSIAINGLLTTDQLVARASAYAAASGDPQSFDYSAWALDRVSLPAILRARSASSGDARAGMAADALDRLETGLVAAAGVQSPNYAQLEGTLDEIQTAVGNLGQNGVENLDPLRRIMDGLGRALDRRQQQNTELQTA